MSINTTNYNLVKPTEEEFYDVAIPNSNMDKIDAALTPAADPTLVPTGLSGKLVQWVSWITNRLKAISGATNWWDNPVKTLKEIWEDLVSHKADTAHHVNYADDTGSANAYVVTLSPVPAIYTTGMVVIFKAAHTNTGASTLNVNSCGAKIIKTVTLEDLPAYMIVAGQIITVMYDGTYFILLSMTPSVPITLGTTNLQKIQAGSSTATVVTPGTAATTAVTFGTAFVSAPNIELSIVYLGGGDAGYVNIAAINITATGFTFRLNSYIAQAVNVNWVAKGN